MTADSSSNEVAVFFYGSYINLEVLAEVELNPKSIQVGRVSGFEITIRPLANLVRSDRHTVFGILVRATHAELERLYDHASAILGGVYLPEAILVELDAGQYQPAL